VAGSQGNRSHAPLTASYFSKGGAGGPRRLTLPARPWTKDGFPGGALEARGVSGSLKILRHPEPLAMLGL